MEWKSILENYPQHTQAIGMISIENANLETALADLFARSLFIPIKTAHSIYLTPKSAIARLEVFQAAATTALNPTDTMRQYNPKQAEKQEKDLSRIIRIISRAKSTIGKRHGIIHDAWGAKNGSEDISRYAIAQAYTDKGTPVTLTHLNEIIYEYRKLIGDCIELAKEFKSSPPFLVSMLSSSE